MAAEAQRHVRAADAARLHIEQLVVEGGLFGRERRRQSLMGSVSVLGAYSEQFDYAQERAELFGASVVREAGKDLLEAIRDEQVPAGVRAIYEGEYGADLKQYDAAESAE